MKLFVTLLSLLLSITASSQENEERIIILQNDTLKINPTDSIIYNIGDSINGQIRIRSYNSFEFNVYYADGEIIKEIYFHRNGTKWQEKHFLNKKENGVFRRWLDNGSLLVQGYYLNGNMDSLWIYYHGNGKIAAQGHFNPAILIEDLEIEFNYMKDVYSIASETITSEVCASPDGEWYFYDQTGLLIKTIEFKNGNIKRIEIGEPPKYKK